MVLLDADSSSEFSSAMSGRSLKLLLEAGVWLTLSQGFLPAPSADESDFLLAPPIG